MTNRLLLEILSKIPPTTKKFDIFYWNNNENYQPYKFYYNREKTCICLDMEGIDLHIITVENERNKGHAKELLEKFVLKQLIERQVVTLSGDGMYLKRIFIENGYKILIECNKFMKLEKGEL